MILFHPETLEGKKAFVNRVSDVHASAVAEQIVVLNCPIGQKSEILDAVIKSARAQNNPKE